MQDWAFKMDHNIKNNYFFREPIFFSFEGSTKNNRESKINKITQINNTN